MRLPVSRDMTSDNIAEIVKQHFENSEPYLHLTDLNFHELPPEKATSYIRSFARKIGTLTLSTVSPNSDVWGLDGLTSPSRDRIPFHTDSPYLEHPEDIVSFWNMRESGRGGENVILPIDRIIALADTKPEVADLLEELNESNVIFKHDGNKASGNIVDLQKAKVRFDKRYVLGARAVELAAAFHDLIESSDDIADVIKLNEGDVLFF